MYTLEKLNQIWKEAILQQEDLQQEDDLEILNTEGEYRYGYFVADNFDSRERYYYFPDTKESLVKRVLMDAECEKLLDKEKLTEFLLTHTDENALMVLRYIVFVWDDEDKEQSTARTFLEDDLEDEYAREIGDGEDYLGITWVEKQTVVINVRNILDSSIEIANEPGETHSLKEIFLEGLCQTIFHECRHLFYECNELIPIGQDTEYPSNGGLEDEVEEYGNTKSCLYLNEFTKVKTKEFSTTLSRLSQELLPEEIER